MNLHNLMPRDRLFHDIGELTGHCLLLAIQATQAAINQTHDESNDRKNDQDN